MILDEVKSNYLSSKRLSLIQNKTACTENRLVISKLNLVPLKESEITRTEFTILKNIFA